MAAGVRRILLLQIGVAVAAGALMVGVRPGVLAPALAAGYGCAMALVNTGLLARRAGHIGAATAPAQLETMKLLLGVVERFLFTLVAFALGMGAFGLDPLALLVGFAGAQFGSVIAGVQSQVSGAAAVGQPSQRADW